MKIVDFTKSKVREILGDQQDYLEKIKLDEFCLIKWLTSPCSKFIRSFIKV